MNTSGHPKKINERLLDKIIAEYLRRVDNGEQVDREKMIANFPDLADDLRSFFDSSDLAEQLAAPNQPSDSSLTGLETIRPGGAADSAIERLSDKKDKPERFGRYEIIDTLGQGAMGVVYLAIDSQLDRKVALKIPTFSAHEREELLQRFHREAKAAATLNHPNICQVYDVGEMDGSHYIAMAYIDGKPLSRYVSAEKPMNGRRAAFIVRKLALALHHAHQHGIIHRDLKPANIMIGKQREPILTDFGLARQINTAESARMTQSGAMLGTPAYMSPEQVEGDLDTVGPASDIYGLGVIFYELLTGELPFQGSVAAVLAQVISQEPEKPSTLRPGLDRRLESICLKMMSKPIGNRFASMNEVAEALTHVLKTPEERTGQAVDASTRQTHSGSKRITVLTISDAQALCRTARKRLRDHDYEQAARMLEQVPEHLRDDEINQLIEQANELNDEVSYLSATVEDAEARQDCEGLLPSVERLLELKPGHRQAFEIYKKLSSRRGPARRSRRKTSRAAVKRKKRTALASIGVVLVLIASAITVYIRTGNVTVKIVIDDTVKAKNVQVRIDGQRISITNIGETIELTVGDHELEIRRGNTIVKTRDFRIVRGKNDVLAITLVDVPVERSSKEKKVSLPAQQPLEKTGPESVATSTKGKELKKNTGTHLDPSKKDVPPVTNSEKTTTAEDPTQRTPEAQAAVFRKQSFDSDPKWAGVGHNRNKNNFGFRTSKHAGGRSGEAGGKITRSGFARYYADTNLGGTLTLDHEIRASGKIDFRKISEAPDFGSGFWVGHFETGTTSNTNRIGLIFNNASGDQDKLAWGARIHIGNKFSLKVPLSAIELNKNRTWEYHWDPNGGVHGAGRFTVTLLGPGGGTKVIDLMPKHRRVGARFNAFGLNAAATSTGDNPNRFAEVYIDDVTYSAFTPGSDKGSTKSVATGRKGKRSKQTTDFVGMKFMLIPAGEFRMGSRLSAEETARLFSTKVKYFKAEHPQHRVKISKPFYLGQYEVTLGQFREFVSATGYKTDAEKDGKGGLGFDKSTGKLEGHRPKYNWRNTGWTQTDEHPVVNVTWNDAVAFCRWLSRKDGNEYRLPTEAEWEYACRAGKTSLYQSGDEPRSLARVGNVADGTAKAKFSNMTTISAKDGHVFTAPVGMFQPNRFGLFDMHGNVWEWCSDWYGKKYYRQSLVTDPTGPSSGSSRVLRGGSWYSDPQKVRSAYRGDDEQGNPLNRNGFRVLRTYNRSSDEKTSAASPKPIKVVPNSPKAKAGIVAAIRKAAGKPTGEITEAELKMMTRLSLIENQITDLEPLAELKEMKWLNLHGNQVTDLTPLAGLTKLGWLYLSSNRQITDLTPLAELKELEQLSLDNNKITVLTPLVGLTKLKLLHLPTNQITDLSPLAGLTNLEKLSIFNNKISDLTPLAGLTKLKGLSLYDNQITDLTPLAGLKKLERLKLSNNPNLTTAEIGRLQKVLPNCKISHNATKTAIVKVFGNPEYDVLDVGKTVFSNRKNAHWTKVPASLRGQRVTKFIVYHGLTKFNVIKSGKITMAVFAHDWGGGGGSGPWQKELVSEEQLRKQKWIRVESLRSEESNLLWHVYVRDCTAGESFAVRTHKYLAPVLIGAPTP